MTVSSTRRIARAEASPLDGHIVQFYETDEFLTKVVTGFVVDGLTAGEPVLLIATDAHRRAFLARLEELGIAVDDAVRAGQLATLDAREVLAGFMVGPMPDWERFSARLGATLTRLAAGAPRGRVRAFGEMVDILWLQGNRAGAVVLEEMWNELARRHAFSLLCAYVVSGFYKASERDLHDVCHAHGHVLPPQNQCVPVSLAPRDASLAREHVRALVAEVEHRRQVEAALRDALADRARLVEDLQEAVRVNERFTGILAHDLRSPLAAIMTAAQLALRHVDGGSLKVEKGLTRILGSGERMARMVDQLLDFTRLRMKEGIPVRPVDLDLRALVDGVVEELSYGCDEADIEVEHVGDTRGTWDPDRLGQVVSNLVGNAVHHGERRRPVAVRVDGSAPDLVRVEVHNHGAIPPELLERLFDPFMSERGRGSPQGLGLGLYITREMIVAHGGRIEVTSTAAAGTVFSVSLPRLAAPR